MMVGASTWFSLASAVLMALMALQETSAQVFDDYYEPEVTKAPTHPGKCPSWCKTTAGKFKCCLDIIESDITVQVGKPTPNFKSEVQTVSEVPIISEAIEYTADPEIDDFFTVTESFTDSEVTTTISVDDIQTIVPDLIEVVNISSEADLSLVDAWSVFVINNTNYKKGQMDSVNNTNVIKVQMNPVNNTSYNKGDMHPVNITHNKKGQTHPSLCPSWCKTTAGTFKCCLDIIELCPADSNQPLGSCPRQTKCYDSHGCYKGEVCCWDRCYGHGVCVEPYTI